MISKIISGNYYRVRWRMQNDQHKIVIVKVNYHIDVTTMNATIIFGNFKKFKMTLNQHDIIEDFGTLEEFRKNHAEYWV